MENILSEIKSVSAVIGSYIHVAGVTAANSDLPNIFQNKIYDVGDAVDRIIKVNEATKMHANNIEFKFEEAVIIIRPIAPDASLITFCEPGVNKKNLNMTTGMLANELKEAADKIRAAGSSSPEVTPEPISEEAEKGQNIDINKILHAGPLATVFLDFQNAFAMAIGPIGEMVMKDTAEEWAKNGECSKERLVDLVDMLCKEIDDKSLEDEFKATISKHL